MLRKSGPVRALDLCHRPEGSWALGPRMRYCTVGGQIGILFFFVHVPLICGLFFLSDHNKYNFINALFSLLLNK